MTAISLAYLEITNTCNLRCASCYNAPARSHGRAEMPPGDFQKGIRMLADKGCGRIILSGGEPTLHSAFPEMLSAMEPYPAVRWGLVTNGTRFPDSLERALSGGLRLDIQVSLDGSCEEVNAKTRGEGHFQAAWESLERFAALAGRVTCKMVLSRTNFLDLETFYRRVTALGVTPAFAFLLRQGNGASQWEEKSLSPREKAQTLRQIAALNAEYRQEVELPYCAAGCPFAGEKEEPLSLLVKADGTIQPCQSLYDGAFSLGNLFRFDRDVFDKRLGDFSAAAKERLGKDWSCRTCLARSFCGKGCPASALSYSGDILGNDGDCEFRRLQALQILASSRKPEGEQP